MRISRSAGRILSAVAIVSLAATAGSLWLSARSLETADGGPTPQQRIAQLPLFFEVNRGQGDAMAQYLARGPGYEIALAASGPVYTLSSPVKGTSGHADGHASRSVVRMTLAGADPAARDEALQRQPGVSNYLRSRDSRQWLRNVEHFAQIKYRQVYPGVDLVYYGSQHQLEYDFRVAPHRDPAQIALEFDGVRGIRVDARGDLVLSTDNGDLVQHRPLAYQERQGRRHRIEASYAVLDGHRVGFALGNYDREHELVIDPVLTYSTFAGNGRNDRAFDITLDNAGNIYVVGDGHTPEPGVEDVVVSKYNAAGTALIYRTYLGADNAQDSGAAIAVDASGQAWIAGRTGSLDFPTTSNALQPTAATTPAGFVAKLGATGDHLLYSTYFGYYGDWVNDIVLDAAGNAYITGYSGSHAVKTLSALQPTAPGGSSDAFFAKFSATGTLLYSSYLGGSKDDYGTGIALGSDGSVYVTGATSSTNFPLMSARQSTNAGGAYDAFVVRISPNGRPLLYSSYHGGSGSDEAQKIAVDRGGNMYLIGDTTSTNFPLANALRPNYGGLVDAFVTKLNSAGALVYSTYLGGNGDDFGRAIAVEGNGMVHVTGRTYSSNFPVAAPIMDVSGGPIPTAFVTRLDPGGRTMVGSLLGAPAGAFGQVNVMGEGIAVDPAGNAWVTGYETPVDPDFNDFPIRTALQPHWDWGSDVFIARFGAPVSRSWGGDFDGDGKDDILWRNSITGANIIWRLVTNSHVQQNLPTVAPSWSIAAIGDFDADGKSDILWRNQANGANVIWPAADGLLARAMDPVSPNWSVAGAGDFDGDARSDLLWRDLVSGANAIWRSADKATPQTLATVNLDWRVAGVGDFDGDGHADILWNRRSNGDNVLWKSAAIGETLTPVRNRVWYPVAVADFNGDARADVLWRADSLDRSVIWLSASAATQQSVSGMDPNSSVAEGWFLVGAGDYDGDGKSDALWRNTITGENQVWKAANSATQMPIPDTSVQAWSIQS